MKIREKICALLVILAVAGCGVSAQQQDDKNQEKDNRRPKIRVNEDKKDDKPNNDNKKPDKPKKPNG